LTMNATGTERQLAVLAAFRVKPEASNVEIAKAAGVSPGCVSLTIEDNLTSKANARACPVSVRATPKPVECDIATFAPDRRFGGNAGPAACTVKQQACRSALATHPRAEGESKMEFCRRIAAVAGVSASYVQNMTKLIECEEIGATIRAREAAIAKVAIVPRVVSLGPVPNFKNWIDAFSKFKATAEIYLVLAQTRGDTFAGAFLRDIIAVADRAQTRAAKSQVG
jgi:hypothetical protein